MSAIASPEIGREALNHYANAFAYGRNDLLRRQAENDLRAYCLMVAPELEPAEHHDIQIKVLEMVASGQIKRLIIMAPPGSAKSTYGSKRFVSWYRGRHPSHNIIQACHTTGLAESFGREVRDTCMTEEHMATFPACRLSEDGKARGDWRTTKGGTYYAAGIGRAVTGRRAMLAVIDDPVKDRQDADSPTIRDWTYEWYRSALRTRLLPGGRIVISTTRWHYDDLVGRILPENWNGQWGWVRSRTGELWFVLNFPQESEDEEQDIMRRPKGDLLWPSFYTHAMMAQEKKEGTRNWNALHQQRPQEEEGSILLSSYWRKWPLSKPPVCEYLMSVYDTAFEESEIDDNDYSARTSWAVFDIFEQDWGEIGGPPAWLSKSTQRYHAILVEAWRARIGFPGLRKEAQEHYSRFMPDKVMVEKKASGHSLIQELRKSSVPVSAYDPKGKSKTERASSASIAFEQGCVWYMDRTWAQDVITECSRFPSGAHDDWVDTVSMAINYLRRMYHLRFKFETDEENNRIHQLRQMAHEAHTGRYSGVTRHAH